MPTRERTTPKRPALNGRARAAADAQTNGSLQDVDARETQLFRSLDVDNDQRVLRSDLLDALADVGLRSDDRRLAKSIGSLSEYAERENAARQKEIAETEIPRDAFCEAIRPSILLIERALQGKMVIPDFPAYSQDIEGIYRSTRENRSGKAANYIPQLDLKDPEVDQYGVSICTIDGQRYSVGDSRAFFSLQSTVKPVLYALALEEHGAAKVHDHIGHEPSGASFNALALNGQNRPHNPMINAGAIMSSSLIKLREKREKLLNGDFSGLEKRGWAGTRFDYVMERCSALSTGETPRFSSPVYLSERQTADRNFALGYFMREKDAFPDGIDLEDVLDFYFQACAIEMNVEMMSLVAATLANGGINPISGERVFRPETVRHVLSLMSSCGMYDYSGEFAFSIGLPAKSGVSGALLIVVPNVMGIATWSPRLDEHGNSVRGIEFCRHLVETFNFHNYDNITGVSGKKDPRLSRIERQASQVNELIWAASKGDLGAIQHQMWRGADLNIADYDLRTPLHLAAAEGQTAVVQFFVGLHEEGRVPLNLNPLDRWGNTPLDDARAHGHDAIVELLKSNGGKRGDRKAAAPSSGRSLPAVNKSATSDAMATTELIWAAGSGNLSAIRRLVARGYPLDVADYDLRTPLHLAAAEGHVDTVRYLLAQQVVVNPQDRWGFTPADDARRHGHAEVHTLLGSKGHTSVNNN